MSPRKKAQAAFASALLLLFFGGLATHFATTRLLQSEDWVIHTHEVRATLGDIDAAMLRAGRARSGYVISGNDEFLSQFDAAVVELPLSLQRLRRLTQDNSKQQEFCSRLEDATARRIALLRESIQLHIAAPGNDEGQTELASRAVPISSDITSITQQMREQEQRLLETRKNASHRFVIVTVVT